MACINYFSATIDAEYTDDCGNGDANGSPEQHIGQKTWDECMEDARALGANCVTMGNPCPDKCACFAEFKCDKRGGGGWYGCIFYPGE